MSGKGSIHKKPHLSKENEFLVFAVEYYRNAKNLTGEEVAELFLKNGVYQLIIDNYFLYHIESPNNFVFEIDERIKCGPSWTPARLYEHLPRPEASGSTGRGAGQSRAASSKKAAEAQRR